MKRLWLTLFLFIILISLFWLIFINKEDKNKISNMFEKEKNLSVRQAAFTGQYYSQDKEELIQEINSFLEKAKSIEIKGEIKGLIVPHAGYRFSGLGAASAFKLIKNKGIEKVILLGCSHNKYSKGAIIDGNDIWENPLGQVKIDNDLREEFLKESNLFQVDSGIHKIEHSLEVEIPFLQAVLGDFRLLPILISHELSNQEREKIGGLLAKYIDDKTLIVASSDMSHYPDYEKANYIDKKIIDSILTGKNSALRETVKEIENEEISNLSVCLCAQKAIEVFMEAMKEIQASNIDLLDYYNSGDVEIGDKSRVVGYGSFAFFQKEQELVFNQKQRQKLLEIAETSVENYILKGELSDFQVEDELLNKEMGAFVTLKKDNQLRGCIGVFESKIPLCQVVSQMAVAAAVKDNRFYPVHENELEDLEYEISVLSPLKKVKNWEEIEIGKHGVKIEKGNNSGVFLPQVAVENNWDLEQFMNELCLHKAGLEKDCWKKDDVDIYIFTAEIIK